MDNKLPKLKMCFMANEYVDRPWSEIKDGLITDYGFSKKQAEIIVRRAKTLCETPTAEANPVRVLDAARNIAEFHVVLANDGAYAWNRLPMYVPLAVRDGDDVGTILCAVRDDGTKQGLMDEIRAAVKEYRNGRGRGGSRITVRELGRIPDAICAAHGLRVMAAFEPNPDGLVPDASEDIGRATT